MRGAPKLFLCSGKQVIATSTTGLQVGARLTLQARKRPKVSWESPWNNSHLRAAGERCRASGVTFLPSQRKWLDKGTSSTARE